MEIKLLEHVNLRTTNVARLQKWYTRILGLKKGYRPPFGVKGAWMYAGNFPIVHLREAEGPPQAPDPRMEHFAMRASGLKTFLDRLESWRIPYTPLRVPELRILQINITDPDGNNMHIDFPPDEADALGFD
jgi:catechol 2,3-dioxygenase-like lactoylglutathione lyase family enzyme